MWMKDNRATRILSTVLYKHKYITNPDITPEYQLIVESCQLADKLKCCMSPHLIETTLEQLDIIKTIIKQGSTQTVQKNPPGNPPTPPSPPLPVHLPL